MIKCIKITPKKLRGTIKIPPSKSLSHRGVIAASLSSGISNIDNIMFSEDIVVTREAMEKLGAKIENTGENKLKIEGSYPKGLEKEEIYSKESGSTLRFLIPISLLSNTNVIFTGEGKLVSRPLDPYYEIFDKQKIKYKNNNGELPLQVKGKLESGEFEVEGNISSQFISGLLFTLPLLQGDSKIKIKGKLESRGYVDLTIDVLNKFGIKIENNDYQEFNISGGQKYESRDYRVEGDFSQAAFWLVGGILGEEIKSEDLNLNSLQGDKAIVDLIEKMGGNISLEDSLLVTRESKTQGISVDISEFPDIVPVLTVLAALSEGQTKILNGARLRIKESDRLKAISTELNKLGADVKEVGDSLVINGKKNLKGGEVDSWGDHRIAMALAIASIRCTEEVIIKNSEVVNKSYPHFWKDFEKMGGQIHEFDLGE